MRRSPLLAFPFPLALAVLASCADVDRITESVPTEPSHTIAHGATGFKAGFYFLPPMAPNPGFGGTLDDQLSPVVEICELAAGECAHHVVTFTMDDSGSERVRLEGGAEHYIVNWHTDRFGLATSKRYRIAVRANGVLLGYAEVQLVSGGNQVRNVDTQEYIALVDGRTLPIKFRIETGIIAGLGIDPPEAAIGVGETQPFTVTATDLHGNGVAVVAEWTSSDASIATVDGSGVATGVAPGSAHITASFDHESASATLTVQAPAAPAFVTTWDTGLGAGTTVTLALDGSVDATIDWGDGTVQHVTTPGPHVHGYGADGVYTVAVTGTVTAYNGFLRGGDASERAKLVSVESWGDVGFTSMASAFHGATNLTAVPATSEGLENVTNMARMFEGALAFNAPIGTWNTANVTFMGGMFLDARAFNQPIGHWNTANVIDMTAMFMRALAFNQPIGHWNTAKVTSMNGMFASAQAFNQPIGHWNTASVTAMASMFQGAVAFNQPIGAWNTAAVTNMSNMFMTALAFNQDLSGWCVSQIPSAPENFDATAMSWTQPRPVWGTCPGGL